jgi:hypothetical protein
MLLQAATPLVRTLQAVPADGDARTLVGLEAGALGGDLAHTARGALAVHFFTVTGVPVFGRGRGKVGAYSPDGAAGTGATMGVAVEAWRGRRRGGVRGRGMGGV